MLEKILTALIPFILSLLTADQLKKFADMAIDFVEDAVQDSANTIDDTVVLPILKRLRDTFNIPDND
jgi:hypothetical protein